MHQPPLPLTRDLVLIGGGHSHALVLRKWGMSPLPGARLTLINPGPTAPYSGMLPGFVAGHYTRDALDIDLVRLARYAGARLVLGAVTGMNAAAKTVSVGGRPPIAYDVASVNVGITSDMPAVPGFAEHAVPAKPLGPFAEKWAAYLAGTGPARVAVIGGGVAGAELVMAMAHALKSRGRLAEITLVDQAQALSATGPKAARLIRQTIAELGVSLIENTGVARIDHDKLVLSTGQEIEADFITGAAGARPYDWTANCGLDLHEGYISVDAHLRSSDPSVFAAGDCAHLSFDPRPKAGVYAVREAPILLNNLRAAMGVGRPKTYKPQRDYLKLISLGGKSALAERLGTAVQGGLMWRWKDHIDQTFMTRFRDLPEMPATKLPAEHAAGMAEAVGDKPMCGGCGAKVGRGALRQALAPMVPRRADVTPLPGDDAALLQTGGARQVMTSDHLRSLTDDPVVMTRIAAVHALGDIWAMGAEPQAATVTLILPRLAPALQQRTLTEIMTTADQVLMEAGAEIVGGHTSVGDELTIGFTLTGLCPRPPITLGGGQPGDVLILTKPIGSGVIMAAEMAGQARGEWVASALDHMTRPQGQASRILKDAHAMTDVTGFGLAGHLQGLAEASGCGADLDLTAIPTLPGAEPLAAQGVRSTLYADNRNLAPELSTGGKADLLFDPQTAGGLLAAVSLEEADDLLTELHAAGYPAARIGVLTKAAALNVTD
ncbi:selenide, water dikinase SelD [Falsiruegeria mediterranea]|uniref:Selenide, water dikinase n=1 Tax=Falsiruegeria mediterranea M17 TaxID=1200281 RepID=A0A2R8CCM0_9RHOB|nr:selenide, water dikinase SelD [Falsiruegeria mediterranea]SPJ30173.1 Selenide, water dikinase [Falsiruegeria mediterranea M17]